MLQNFYIKAEMISFMKFIKTYGNYGTKKAKGLKLRET